MLPWVPPVPGTVLGVGMKVELETGGAWVGWGRAFSQGAVFPSNSFTHVHFTVDIKGLWCEFQDFTCWERYSDHLPFSLAPASHWIMGAGKVVMSALPVGRPGGCGEGSVSECTIFMCQWEKHRAHLFPSQAEPSMRGWACSPACCLILLLIGDSSAVTNTLISMATPLNIPLVTCALHSVLALSSPVAKYARDY